MLYKLSSLSFTLSENFLHFMNFVLGNGLPQSPFSPMDLPNRARVMISCPESGNMAERLVLLPDTIQELLDIGEMKFGFCPTKVLTKDGALVEDQVVIRDGDHLILAGDGPPKRASSL